jgi:hypothetical protein
MLTNQKAAVMILMQVDQQPATTFKKQTNKQLQTAVGLLSNTQSLQAKCSSD